MHTVLVLHSHCCTDEFIILQGAIRVQPSALMSPLHSCRGWGVCWRVHAQVVHPAMQELLNTTTLATDRHHMTTPQVSGRVKALAKALEGARAEAAALAVQQEHLRRQQDIFGERIASAKEQVGGDARTGCAEVMGRFL